MQNNIYTEQFLQELDGGLLIIGNGLIKKVHSGIADTYNNVIRMNNFQIVGYETIVGTKITAWLTNCWKDVPMRDISIPYFTPISKATAGEQSRITLWVKENAADQLIYCKESWLSKFEQEHFSAPTTGLLLLYILAKLHIKAKVIGFNGFQTGHYWDPSDKITPAHNPSREVAIIHKLIQQIGGTDESRRNNTQ